jgi:hypothetical protein
MDVEEDGAITNAFVIANRLDLHLAVHERVFNSSVVITAIYSAVTHRRREERYEIKPKVCRVGNHTPRR